MVSSKANGQDIVDNRFTVLRATDVLVKFTIATGIDSPQSGRITVSGEHRAVVVTTSQAAKVAIFDTNGKKMFDGTVNGTQTIQLDSGIYIVKTNGVTKSILVK